MEPPAGASFITFVPEGRFINGFFSVLPGLGGLPLFGSGMYKMENELRKDSMRRDTVEAGSHDDCSWVSFAPRSALRSMTSTRPIYSPDCRWYRCPNSCART